MYLLLHADIVACFALKQKNSNKNTLNDNKFVLKETVVFTQL